MLLSVVVLVCAYTCMWLTGVVDHFYTAYDYIVSSLLRRIFIIIGRFLLYIAAVPSLGCASMHGRHHSNIRRAPRAGIMVVETSRKSTA